ncbi:MAG: hypothetical protein J2P38_00380 [Candidatus Dormibacteraeota bacterium]|nr:hypothetical protein [Candidatus Dormibacteraeota bacterium]
MIERTILEQQRARFFQRRRQEELDAPRRLLRETDELMFWVEECLVQELRIVPGWLMPRVNDLLRTADPDLARSLERERRPEAILDHLFAAQQHFMEASRLSRAPARIIPLFSRRSRPRENAAQG